MTAHHPPQPQSLDLDRYRSLIDLDRPRAVEPADDWPRALQEVLERLGLPANGDPPANLQSLHEALAPLEPHTLDDALVDRIEAVNAAVIADTGLGSGIIAVNDLACLSDDPDLTTGTAADGVIALVKADITRLDADAIVNAANQYLLGCRIPGHRCVDNAIHSGAGPRLRDDCAAIMDAQGALEPVGTAKVTRGHALPARYVIHTVGPQPATGAEPTDDDRRALAACYRSCLDLAATVDDIRSIAFCGISTGVFAFPHRQAAAIAVATIVAWFADNPGRLDHIIIDCFSDDDIADYRDRLARHQ